MIPIFLTGYRDDYLDSVMGTAGFKVGLLVQPLTKNYLRRKYAKHYTTCGVDNGCFTPVGRARFTWAEYERIIKLAQDEFQKNLMFVTAQDEPMNWQKTLFLSLPQLTKIRALNAPAALVLQDGATTKNVPWGQFDALFIGGSTEWKIGMEAELITKMAKQKGVHVHMGRVNSTKRLRIGMNWGVDTADGTFLMHETRKRTDHMLKILLSKPENRHIRPGTAAYQALVKQASQDASYASVHDMMDWFRHMRRDTRLSSIKSLGSLTPDQLKNYELSGIVPLRDPDFDFEDNENPYLNFKKDYWGSPEAT